jgi:hypothetical protein
MTQLQHLELVRCRIPGQAAGVAQLLSHLQPLQQLTYLELSSSLHKGDPSTPAEAYSAVTASSMLQHLGLNSNILPACVWQHVFPAGWQLTHLTTLRISGYYHPQPPPRMYTVAPGGGLIVRCCPALQV